LGSLSVSGSSFTMHLFRNLPIKATHQKADPDIEKTYQWRRYQLLWSLELGV
jgi:hypothetical protein